ncbi:MAG: hypothetical protein J6S67_07490 [Methanobrevibacter sp.]|nr:hypothetical protein [Methanobrevibacter sp.]
MAGRKKKEPIISEITPPKESVSLEIPEEIEEVLNNDTNTAELTEYEQLLKQCGEEPVKAVFKYCFTNNLFFSHKILRAVLYTSTDPDIATDVLERYRAAVENDNTITDKTFFGQLRLENFEKIYSEDYAVSLLGEEDKKNRMQVIDILGYDPFRDDALQDQPQLYRDLAGLLTENMRKDVAKAKAALTIVRGYNNLEKYQKKINDIMKSGEIDDDTQKTLDQLIKIQKTLTDSINSTSEKHNFIVKGIGNAGQGMLSDVMERIGTYGIDEGVVNFYDIATSKSIEEIANISFKAQLNQINLSKTDYADILARQVQIVKESQDKARKAIEALRVAKEKIKKQELIEELAMEYRKKGIKEAEIEEFINREYKLYEME